MSPATPKQRRSARVILLSPENKVLLISYVIQRSDGAFAFWATPGGEIEGDESDVEAARRELREEVGLCAELHGPVHVATAMFEHNGAMIANTDAFFMARCAHDAPRLQAFTEQERASIRGSRWWNLEEIETTRENVFPADLSAVVRRLMQG